jgi:hypothetical protein
LLLSAFVVIAVAGVVWVAGVVVVVVGCCRHCDCRSIWVVLVFVIVVVVIV